jgi:large subunit ribosomal protein L5e
LDTKYIGQAETVDGTYFLVSKDGAKYPNAPRPFKCNLDVGLTRTTTGNRVFGALKGACDGGLLIPHSEEGKRFPGWNQKEKKYDPSIHKKYIFGGHVASYMKHLEEKDQARYKTQFSRFIKENIKHDGLEKLYASVHQAIRKDPKSVLKHGKTLSKEEKKEKKGKSFSQKRLTLKEKKDSATQRKLALFGEDKKEETVEDEEVDE